MRRDDAGPAPETVPPFPPERASRPIANRARTRAIAVRKSSAIVAAPPLSAIAPYRGGTRIRLVARESIHLPGGFVARTHAPLPVMWIHSKPPVLVAACSCGADAKC